MNLKRKRKSTESTLPKWLDPIIGPLDIDFVAPYPLDTTVKILNQSVSGKTTRPPEKRIVSIFPADAMSYSFVVTKSGLMFPLATARGIISRRSKNTTLVRARINAPFSIYLISAFIVIGLFLIALLMVQLSIMSEADSQNYWGVLSFIAIVLIYWVSLRGESRDLARTIEVNLRARRPKY